MMNKQTNKRYLLSQNCMSCILTCQFGGQLSKEICCIKHIGHSTLFLLHCTSMHVACHKQRESVHACVSVIPQPCIYNIIFNGLQVSQHDDFGIAKLCGIRDVVEWFNGMQEEVWSNTSLHTSYQTVLSPHYIQVTYTYHNNKFRAS